MSNTEKTPAWALDNVRFTSGCVPEGGDGDAFVLDMIAEMRQGVGA
jgi:hypothetical protein